MKRIKLFEQFIAEKEDNSDLHKIYLAINPDSGHRWWSYKDFAGDNFFIQVTLDNYKDIDINPDYPILTYNSGVTQKLLDEGLIKKQNVYNLPEHIKKSGSKAEFHKLVDGDENIPKTVDNPKDALKIGFPLIGKPAEGHSGLGIQIFKDQKAWDDADHSKLDVYSEYIDKAAEHRLITFKGKPFFWMQREPMNDKAKSGDGKGDEQMMFKYIKKDVTKIPQKFNDLVEKFGKIFSDLPYICFDIMEDKSGKLYIIESNSQPGVPFDSTVQAYRQLFNDFYGRDVNPAANTELEKLSDYMINKTLELDPKRFEVDGKN
ncbi:MAG: ATP-grasp domain-containing protein [Dolichospermum sp.]